MAIETPKVRDSGDLNAKSMQPGRNSDKVDQEGKNGDCSSQVNRSYKKADHSKKSNKA